MKRHRIRMSSFSFIRIFLSSLNLYSSCFFFSRYSLITLNIFEEPVKRFSMNLWILYNLLASNLSSNPVLYNAKKNISFRLSPRSDNMQLIFLFIINLNQVNLSIGRNHKKMTYDGPLGKLKQTKRLTHLDCKQRCSKHV